MSRLAKEARLKSSVIQTIEHSLGMTMQSSRHGFTLVELSIVLVILGLLVGGVLTGQALIRSAELRSIVTERDRYVTALHTFRDKYMALPGDMANAYAYWGATCGTNTTAAGTGCNGDGNGNIHRVVESTKLWEHLSRAGLVEGSYDGMGGGTGNEITRAAIPASKFSGGYWVISEGPFEDPAGSNGWADLGAKIAIGSVGATDNGMATGGSYDDGWLGKLSGLTNSEALNVDIKSDDGRANTGRMRGKADTCDDSGTDIYRLTSMGADSKGNCTLGWIL